MAETRFDDGPSSCHIAISAGDVLLAKFLQSEGYPDEDSSGRSMLFYGENSKDEVVQEWYNDEKRREMFRSNVATLCSMVFEEQPSWEAIKSHVSETNCMTDKLWLENGYEDPEKSVGQTGRSFWAIVDRVAETADSDSLFWFYEQCMPDGYMDPSNHRQGASDMRAFWKRTKSGANDLDALRMTNGESDLRRLLEKTKKKVTSEEFFALKKVCSEVLFSRSGYNDQLVRNLAAPIDPLLKRIDSKIRLRRSTILMNAISDEKEKLRKSQFLNDLLVSASVLLEKYLREDSTVCRLETAFEEQPSWEAIKSHVSETNCMTDKLWLENGYEDPEKSVGQTGRSFWAIVDRVAETADSDSLFWFYEQCMPDGYMDPSNHRQGASDMRAFWKRTKSGANDLDALRMTNGESDLRRLLEKTKKKVTSEEFFALKKVCSEVLFSRSGYNDQLVRNLAAPIDPLLKRIDSKIRLRRSTILMNAISDEKEKLRKSQFLNDLLVSASVLLEKYLREDSTVCSLETALLGLGAASKLLKKEHPSHPAFLTNSTDFGDSCPFRADNSINPNYKPKAPQELLSFASRNGFGWTIFGLVTSKDHIETLKWLVKKCPDQWEEKCILQMIRLAECCGAEKIIHWLLEEECADNKNERLGFRYLSALLGAAEAGHLAHVKKYFPYAKQFLSNAVSSPKAASPLSAAVMGLYSHADSNGEAKNKVVSRYIESIAWLGSHNEVQRFDAIRTAARCLESSGMRLKLFFAIFKTLTSDDIWSNRDKLGLICRNFLARRIQSKDKQDLISWVRILVKENVDIQMVLDSHVGHGEDGIDLSVVVEVVNLQRKQLLGWSPFWKLYNDVDASEMPWVSTYNSKGLKMIHCASVCNRVDVLQWHILEGMAQFEESDKFNRTAFRLAVATDAASVRDLARWHSQGAKIGTFLSSCYRRKLACLEAQKRMKALNIIQALWMRGLARVKFAAIIETRIYQRKLFDKFWGDLVSEAPTLVHIEPNSWEAIKHFKEEFDLARTPEELAEYGETFEQLDAAGRAALTEDDSDDEGHADNVEKVEGLEEEKKEPDDSDDGEPEEQPGELCKQFLRPIPEMDNIKLTKSVLAWLRKTEQKYVDLFLRRIEQLARGERSRILQKNLTGSKTTIYETYLEQKSAQRIMWTPVVEAGKHSILIWYVARHKEVSRLMALIDHAEQRQAKVFVSAAESLYENDQEANDIMVIDPEDILLDPNGDTPLKLHQVSADNIKKLANPYWEPPLRLTPQERFCVEKKGTVLVLGRSGTGKTLCISNRIDREGSMHNDDPSFKQLFVARSNRICRRVRRLVDKEKGRKCKYYTFQKLLNQCSEMVKESDGLFDNRAYVDFARYKREFYRENKDGLLDPLVIWSQFRTFIKGSILAVQKDRPLEEKEYVEDLGCNACKLNEQQRQCAYSAFLFYKEQLESCNLWDDCDRVHYLLQQIKQVDRNCLDENHYSRIYVDEIQDFTQAELALFYTLCRDHCLFLAGDNAQSVVQGVDFRFEDLRMVAYSLYGANNRYIPEKPLTVSKNFRSHAGVLNVAGGVLERMYAAFPASFKKLPPEKGIFHGPRPGVFRDVDSEGLKSLLERNPGLHVLCHDQTVDSMKDILHCCENNIVMGIRDSKGLEFRDIVIVDFFSNLAEDLQKPFRELLRDREISDIKPGYPQLETQLKLLYTGITRCSRRLFFLETKKSIAGQAFFKWLTRDRFEKDPVGGPGNEFKKLPPLAVNQDASKTENLMTPDEFRSSGVDAAINAESMEDSCSKALFWIERAVRNFERVGDENLLRKALAHKASLEIRVQLEEDPDGYELTEENEEEISKVAHACAKEGLLPELYNLVSVVMPKLSELAQNELKKHLMTNLDEFAA